ncbi:hypothetical protein BEP19_07950 [Ammoniphilus oxalaticus]|uniref:Uncharacterized protein n=1 Tax=Ammoniphilus oxalaticus TaxID=66863 RepID=A0A419SJV7_9BACL|nr:hypothetical protein [Ammoniphilus oxalaticus]RKD24321.1 hypothetical protein BEP19_07950 [Ammoniphilus oxalaticus]
MNHFIHSNESPGIQLKTNIVAGEELLTVRICASKDCIGWSKNLDIEECPFCRNRMVLAEKKIPKIRSVNSCRHCFFLVKSENLCMKKQKKLSFQASDYSEDCDSYKLERRATKQERLEKESFIESWKQKTC